MERYWQISVTAARWMFNTVLFVMTLGAVSSLAPLRVVAYIDPLVSNPLVRIATAIVGVATNLHTLAAGHRKRFLLSSSVLATLLATWYIPMVHRRRPERREGERKLNFATFNIMQSERFDLIKDILSDDKYDVIQLQEVAKAHMDRMAEFFSEQHLNVAFLPHEPSADYGNAVISPHPLDELPPVFPLGKDERGVQRTLLKMPGLDITLLNVHVRIHPQVEDPVEWMKWAQYRYRFSRSLVEWCNRTEGVLIISGDFNMTPSARTAGLFRRSLVDAWKEDEPKDVEATWPRDLPIFRLDYIYYRGFTRNYNTQARWHIVSDHRLMSTVLEYDEAREAEQSRAGHHVAKAKADV